MKYLNDVSYKDCVGKVFKSLNLKQLLVGWSTPTLQRHTHIKIMVVIIGLKKVIGLMLFHHSR